MVSEPLASRIRAFVSEVAEPYELVEKVTAVGIEDVRTRHILRIVELSEARKELILEQLESSWRDHHDHGMRRHWGRAAMGTGQFLLLPTLLSEVMLPHAADVVFRISRWYHSENQLWQRFRPTAAFIVSYAWQNVENLCNNPEWSRVHE